MEYIPRLSVPSSTDKNYIHYIDSGYNYCIMIEGTSVLPNCVGYAWGRWREVLGEFHKLSRGNAEIWYGNNDGYERGEVPKIGSVICWRKGIAGDSRDGAGHVGIVEKINNDGSIVISNSAYKSTKFYLMTMKYPYNVGDDYYFQGFIHLPLKIDEETKKTVDELAQEVINGLWGNNPERKEKLEKAGYSYIEIQNRVNELLSEETIDLLEGDTVKILSPGNASSYGNSNKSYGIGYERKIIKIYSGRPYPYQVGNEFGTTGFYQKNSLKKL